MKTIERLQRIDDHLSEFENRPIRRLLVGLPISSAISAPKGKKWDAYAEGAGHVAKEGLKGTLKGAAVGAGLGALAGGIGLASLKSKGRLGRASRAVIAPKVGYTNRGPVRLTPGASAARLGLALTAGGATVGGAAGALRGTFGKDAAAINEKYEKMRR